MINLFVKQEVFVTRALVCPQNDSKWSGLMVSLGRQCLKWIILFYMWTGQIYTWWKLLE